MLELQTKEGRVWVNPDYIITATDAGGYVLIRTSDGRSIYATNTNAARIASIINGSNI